MKTSPVDSGWGAAGREGARRESSVESCAVARHRRPVGVCCEPGLCVASARLRMGREEWDGGSREGHMSTCG